MADPLQLPPCFYHKHEESVKGRVSLCSNRAIGWTIHGSMLLGVCRFHGQDSELRLNKDEAEIWLILQS
jgi:hypothetical protein